MGWPVHLPGSCGLPRRPPGQRGGTGFELWDLRRQAAPRPARRAAARAPRYRVVVSPDGPTWPRGVATAACGLWDLKGQGRPLLRRQFISHEARGFALGFELSSRLVARAPPPTGGRRGLTFAPGRLLPGDPHLSGAGVLLGRRDLAGARPAPGRRPGASVAAVLARRPDPGREAPAGRWSCGGRRANGWARSARRMEWGVGAGPSRRTAACWSAAGTGGCASGRWQVGGSCRRCSATWAW